MLERDLRIRRIGTRNYASLHIDSLSEKVQKIAFSFLIISVFLYIILISYQYVKCKKLLSLVKEYEFVDFIDYERINVNLLPRLAKGFTAEFKNLEIKLDLRKLLNRLDLDNNLDTQIPSSYYNKGDLTLHYNLFNNKLSISLHNFHANIIGGNNNSKVKTTHTVKPWTLKFRSDNSIEKFLIENLDSKRSRYQLLNYLFNNIEEIHFSSGIFENKDLINKLSYNDHNYFNFFYSKSNGQFAFKYQKLNFLDNDLIDLLLSQLIEKVTFSKVDKDSRVGFYHAELKKLLLNGTFERKDEKDYNLRITDSLINYNGNKYNLSLDSDVRKEGHYITANLEYNLQVNYTKDNLIKTILNIVMFNRSIFPDFSDIFNKVGNNIKDIWDLVNYYINSDVYFSENNRYKNLYSSGKMRLKLPEIKELPFMFRCENCAAKIDGDKHDINLKGFFNNKKDLDLVLNVSNYQSLIEDLAIYLSNLNKESYKYDIIDNNYKLPSNFEETLYSYLKNIDTQNIEDNKNFSLHLYNKNNILFLNNNNLEYKKISLNKIVPKWS